VSAYSERSDFEAMNFRIYGLVTGNAGTTGAWAEPIPVALSLFPTGLCRVTGTRNSRARKLSGLPLLSPRPPFPDSWVPVTQLNILVFKDLRYRNLFRYFLQVPVLGFNNLSPDHRLAPVGEAK